MYRLGMNESDSKMQFHHRSDKILCEERYIQLSNFYYHVNKCHKNACFISESFNKTLRNRQEVVATTFDLSEDESLKF